MQNSPQAPTPAASSLAPDPLRRIVRSRVPDRFAGMRLADYLAARFTYLTPERWRELVAAGAVRISGLKVRPSRRLDGGEFVEFDPPPGRDEPPVRTDYEVLMETEDFLAVCKPPGLPVHPGGIFFRNTLVMLMRERYGIVYPVNRLDRETSGITLLARSSAAARALANLFCLHRVEKQYTALVHGVFPGSLTAEGVLSADPASRIRKKQRFTPAPPSGDSHFCRTRFELLLTDGRLSAVKCLPATGRLHQIRATLYALGFPLAGDKLYGLDETMFLRHAEGTLTEEDKVKLILPHQALHAGVLRFVSPFTKEEIRLEVPPPRDMQEILRRMAGKKI